MTAGDPPLRRERHYGDRVVTCIADRPANLLAMLEAAGDAAAEAVIDGDMRISHGELRGRSAGLVAHLAACGLAAGDRVLLLVGNRWQFVVAVMGLLRAGLITVPVNTRSQPPELAYILEDCGARAVLFDAAFAALLPDAPELIRIDVGETDFAVAPAGDPAAPSHRPNEDEPVAILYTSGTTGRPKGAILTHLGIVHSVLHFAQAFDLTAADRSLMAVPASHVTGLVANIYTALGTGGALLILPRFDVAAFLDLAERERMTHTLMVPAMYNLCLLRADLSAASLGAWRIGAYGGAPMPEATIARLGHALPRLQLRNAYGATETTSPATIMPDAAFDRTDSVGRTVTCGEIRIMDEAGCEVPPGEAGEIWIAGPMVVPGYWQDPSKTAESFVGGFWRSGDIGSLDEDGFLRVFDRLKDVINRGGYKVYSAEVENVLSHHESVAEVAVIPVPDPILGEKVHAVIYPRAGAAVDAEALRSFCAGRLSDYKLPETFTASQDPLPRNANGKVMKKDLFRLLAAGHMEAGGEG